MRARRLEVGCLVRTLEMLGSVQFSVMPRTQTLIDLTAGLLPILVRLDVTSIWLFALLSIGESLGLKTK